MADMFKGFEPSRLKKHMRLKHACLPFHHLRSDRIIILQITKNARSLRKWKCGLFWIRKACCFVV